MIPTSTRTTLRIATSAPKKIDAMVCLVPTKKEKPDLSKLDKSWKSAAPAWWKDKAIGNARETRITFGEPRLVTLGIGAGEVADYRDAGGSIAKLLTRNELNGAIHLEGIDPEKLQAFCIGILLASFDNRENKGTGAEDASGFAATMTLVIPKATKAQKEALASATAACMGQNFARTIAWRPGNVLNPISLAKVCSDMAKDVKLACKTLDEKQMAKLNMGGMLGVGLGAELTPPRMIVLQHKPTGTASKKPLLLVGKAITFDTGGISLKRADRMGKMIFDKCGGMAVMGAMCAIAALKLPVHVVGILAAAENHVSASAYRPGDVLRMYNGMTVEVTNTDAEGRLVLADALAWGIETYKPEAVVDLATLTGGVIGALGRTLCGIMSNHDGLCEEVSEAGQQQGEPMWRLPILKEHREMMKSKNADLINSGGGEAHAIQGGSFLQNFVGETPWVHLDIAGVADTDKETPLYSNGATGWGVRTLVEWGSQRA